MYLIHKFATPCSSQNRENATSEIDLWLCLCCGNYKNTFFFCKTCFCTSFLGADVIHSTPNMPYLSNRHSRQEPQFMCHMCKCLEGAPLSSLCRNLREDHSRLCFLLPSLVRSHNLQFSRENSQQLPASRV